MTDCEQQIYSNEYQDYLIEHTGDEALIKQWYDTDCVQFASRRFAVIYQAATVEDAGIVHVFYKCRVATVCSPRNKY